MRTGMSKYFNGQGDTYENSSDKATWVAEVMPSEASPDVRRNATQRCLTHFSMHSCWTQAMVPPAAELGEADDEWKGPTTHDECDDM